MVKPRKRNESTPQNSGNQEKEPVSADGFSAGLLEKLAEAKGEKSSATRPTPPWPSTACWPLA